MGNKARNTRSRALYPVSRLRFSIPSPLRPFTPLRLSFVLLASLLLAACQPAPGPPRLLVDDSVAPDFEALAQETWQDFLAAFPARTDCFGDVRLQATPDLPSRAAYDPGPAAVSVRVPGAPAFLQSGLVHEWAHHLERQCPEHVQLRPIFLAAQGLPPDADWFHGESWASTPSEQYAEAVVVLVLGRRAVSTKAFLTQEAVQVVRAWAQGQP